LRVTAKASKESRNSAKAEARENESTGPDISGHIVDRVAATRSEQRVASYSIAINCLRESDQTRKIRALHCRESLSRSFSHEFFSQSCGSRLQERARDRDGIGFREVDPKRKEARLAVALCVYSIARAKQTSLRGTRNMLHRDARRGESGRAFLVPLDVPLFLHGIPSSIITSPSDTDTYGYIRTARRFVLAERKSLLEGRWWTRWRTG